ncbi:DUF6318 family protein [Arthrobacter woluwensis]|uniref:DUF6318 family protein n=1 Tax=Arthrobacter woluwensis TaxID=156980 RepID=UPI001AB01869|nr:hypothetical protein G8758_03315 [Arthrobacter woluwensis]
MGYWVNLMSYIYETGDSKPLDGLWTSSCVVCGTIPESLKKVYSDGWIVGGKLRAPSVEVRSTAVKGQIILVAQVIQDKYSVRRNSGVVDSYPGTNSAFTFTVAMSNGKWVLVDSKKIVS